MAESMELQGIEARSLIVIGDVPNLRPEVKTTVLTTFAVNNWRSTLPDEPHSIHPDLEKEDSAPKPETSSSTRSVPSSSLPVAPVSWKSPEYNMGHPRRGTILFFFNEEFEDHLGKPPRGHGWKDVIELQSSFENLGFTWKYHCNSLAADIDSTLKEVSQEDHTDSDCVWIVVSSYGDGNKLYAKDTTYPMGLLWKYFEPNSCPTLAGKPCIVLVQADQTVAHAPSGTLLGMLDEIASPETLNVTVDVKDETAVKHVPSYTIPQKADILFVHNTSSNFAVHGDLTTGSHFFQTLSSVLNDTERIKKYALHELLMLVSQELYPTPHHEISQVHVPILWTTTMREIIFRNAEFGGVPYAGAVQIPPDSSVLKYPMDKPEVGYAHIFHHDYFRDLEERKGSLQDNQRIEETFKKAGFEVLMHDNKTVEKLKMALKKASKQDYSNYNCVVVVVMTHGTRQDGSQYALKLSAYDDLYPLDYIWKMFDKSPTLQNKPKIFIIHACLGRNYDMGFAFLGSAEDDDINDSEQSVAEDGVPQEGLVHDKTDWKEQLAVDQHHSRGADMFIVTSTFPDYKAFRSHSEGSWFIQDFCKVFEDNKKRLSKSFYSMMMEVNRKVGIANIAAGWKQSPLIVTTCKREIFFSFTAAAK